MEIDFSRVEKLKIARNCSNTVSFGNRYAFRIYGDQVSFIGDCGGLCLYEAGRILSFADLGAH